MKKLMIMAAIASATVAAQATMTFDVDVRMMQAYKTGFNATTLGDEGITAASSQLLSGYTLYLFDGDKVDQSAILDGLREDQSIDAFYTTGGILQETLTNGEIAKQTVSISSDNDELRTFVAIVAANDVFLSAASTIEVEYIIGDGDSILLNGASSNRRLDVDGTSGFSGDGWYAITVPEPTSGLMMLLGMAGLALKRRRA